MSADLVRRGRNRWPSALPSPQRFDSRPPISRRKRPCKPWRPCAASLSGKPRPLSIRRHHRQAVTPEANAATIGKPSRRKRTPPPSEAATVRPWRTSNTPRNRSRRFRRTSERRAGFRQAVRHSPAPPVYPQAVATVRRLSVRHHRRKRGVNARRCVRPRRTDSRPSRRAAPLQARFKPSESVRQSRADSGDRGNRAPRHASGLSAIPANIGTPPPSEAGDRSTAPPDSPPPSASLSGDRAPLPACQRFDRAATIGKPSAPVYPASRAGSVRACQRASRHAGSERAATIGSGQPFDRAGNVPPDSGNRPRRPLSIYRKPRPLPACQSIRRPCAACQSIRQAVRRSTVANIEHAAPPEANAPPPSEAGNRSTVANIERGQPFDRAANVSGQGFRRPCAAGSVRPVSGSPPCK